VGSDDLQCLRVAMQLHEAATEAGASDYPGMAGVLDDCGFALSDPRALDRRPLEERAQLALELWRSLRACLAALRTRPHAAESLR